MFTILNIIIINNIQWFTTLFRLELYSLFVVYISIFYICIDWRKCNTNFVLYFCTDAECHYYMFPIYSVLL